jgi:hypothetical protein
MASTKATQHTARSIQTLTNDELIRLFGIVSRDITRRTRVYGGARQPAALLDGIKFVERARKIVMEVMHGGAGARDWIWSLYNARNTLTERLTNLSFDDGDVLEGVDLDA